MSRIGLRITRPLFQEHGVRDVQVNMISNVMKNIIVTMVTTDT